MTGSVQAVNTFGANGLVSRSTTTGSTFYVFDERGNTSVRLDAAGSVLSSHAADAFGGTLALPTGSGADDPYAGYGAQWGYYRDGETGLYLCTFRYYDATEGRWLTPDPIGYAGGVNIYAFVANAPTRLIDPMGLQASTWDRLPAGFPRPPATNRLHYPGEDGGWFGALKIFGDWVAESGPADRVYGAGSQLSLNMQSTKHQSTDGAERMRKLYKKAGSKTIKGFEDSFSAWCEDCKEHVQLHSGAGGWIPMGRSQ